MQTKETRLWKGGFEGARANYIKQFADCGNKHKFVSGYGQFHTNEPTAKNPKPYTQIDFEGIRQLVDKPQEVDKSEAQWLIPSTLPSRVFKEQEENGEYHLLWADIDKDSPDFDRLVEVVKSIIADHDFEAYTTSSATVQNQKARVLIPFSKPLSFADWTLCQSVLNDLLESEGITPDRANERAAQLCYLPNRGEFYKSAHSRTGKLFDPQQQWLSHIQQKRDTVAAEAARLNAEKQAAKTRRKVLKTSDAPDTIGAFKQAFTVQEILLQANYDQRGNTFRHPQSESGSFSASVKNGRVHSLSSNDPLFTEGGGVGAHDAFSAFTVLFHGGDRNAALRDAGDNWLMIGHESWNQVKGYQPTSTVLQFDNLDDLPNLSTKKEKSDFDIDFPPGLAGEVAQYIFLSSRMPVKSFAIAGALSALSHFNANHSFVQGSNTSLNLYQCLVGDTGKGKEDPRKAIKRLNDAIAPTSSLHEILASGAALLRSLEKKPKTLILVDEFGLYLQNALSDRGSIHQKEFIKDLMVLYGLGRSYFAGKSYADMKQNIGKINTPYVNVLGTTTPVELMEGITSKIIDNGFLNRILIIPASKENPINRKPDIEIDKDLLLKINEATDGMFNDFDPVLCYEDGADDLLIQLVEQIDEKGQFANLWSRVEEQTIRVAGLLAVGDGKTIKREHVIWAWRYVNLAISIFAKSLGRDLAETPFQKQVAKALKIITDAFEYSSDKQFSKYCKRGYMPRGKLTKLLKLKSKEVDEITGYLVETKQVSHCELDGAKCYATR
ncbi:MAG: hypothetical protein NMNS01_24870 [Nitrosomonas sp.]|nr:MAG: hypothetical protein NMNS01_24870 [Nitrosomonas sp.]